MFYLNGNSKAPRAVYPFIQDTPIIAVEFIGKYPNHRPRCLFRDANSEGVNGKSSNAGPLYIIPRFSVGTAMLCKLHLTTAPQKSRPNSRAIALNALSMT